jgi:very-short-patch-repair endonuclease
MRLNDHDNTKLDYERARRLRNESSPFEKKLWIALREQAKSHGIKFRRQQAIHPFIADFACMEARLLVELDGVSHDSRVAYDKARDDDLKCRGFFILRFSNKDVAQNTIGIADTIIVQAEKLIEKNGLACLRNAPLPNPPHEGEGK